MEHEADIEGEEQSPAAGVLEQERVQLPSGEALSANLADEFLRSRPAIFVALVGERNAGKTTFIGALYHQFLRGPFASFVFAGSRTMIGFERRWYLARASSGAEHPDTPHTSLQEGLRFFHFRLVPGAQPDQARLDLMLSDRVGETYRSARGKTSLIPELIELRKSHVTALLLDGARVADLVDRHEAVQAVRQLLRACLDNGALDASSRVHVVITKWDCIASDPNHASIVSYLDKFTTALKNDFAARLRELTVWQTAARDPSGKFEPAWGMANLLKSWAATDLYPPPRPRTKPKLANEFDRMLPITESIEGLEL